MEKNIAVIWGDCSSPEIVKQTIRVLDKVAEKYGHTFHYTDAAMGGEAIDKYGDPLPQHELDKCLAADSVLLGAVGGPKWEGLPGEQRPGGVHIADPLQLEQRHLPLRTDGKDLIRLAALRRRVQAAYFFQKIHPVAPKLQLHFPAHTVGGNNFSGFQILLHRFLL